MPESAAAIVDGQLEPDAPYAVAVMHDGVVVCSGALISPDHVLTAAHCVYDVPLKVAFGSSSDDPEFQVDVDFGARHPLYDVSDRRDPQHDVGVLVLREPVSTATIAFYDSTLDSIPPDSDVAWIGYGLTQSQNGESGARRSAERPIEELATDWFWSSGYGGGLACSGDSGGPVVLTSPDGSPRLIGIIHGSDGACSIGGVAMRLDANLEFASTSPSLEASGGCSQGQSESSAPPGALCAVLLLFIYRKRFLSARFSIRWLIAALLSLGGYGCSDDRNAENRFQAHPDAFQPPIAAVTLSDYQLNRRPAVALGDANGDGQSDVFVSDPPTLYLHAGPLRFEQRTDAFLAPENLRAGTAATFVDVDGDGDLDLALGRKGAVDLWEQTGPAEFQWRVALEMAAAGTFPTTVLAADLNSDGVVDIASVGVAIPASTPSLWIQRSPWEFRRDETLDSVSGALSWTAFAGDIDRDGYIDLLVPDDVLAAVGRDASDRAFRGRPPSPEGAYAGQDVSAEWNLAGERSTMGYAVFDADGDSSLDLFTCDFEHSWLWTTSAEPGSDGFQATKVTLSEGAVSWGVRVIDTERSTSPTLAIANGRLSPHDATAGTEPAAIDSLWSPTGAAVLADDEVKHPPSDDRGLAAADFDGDGDEDLMTTPLIGGFRVLEHRGSPGHFIKLNLVGTVSETAAIGAELEVRSASSTALRWIYRGGSPHSESAFEQVVYLADDAPPDVVVRWPSGLVSEYPELSPNTRHTLREPSPWRILTRVAPPGTPVDALELVEAAADELEVSATGGSAWIDSSAEPAVIRVQPAPESEAVTLTLSWHGHPLTVHPVVWVATP